MANYNRRQFLQGTAVGFLGAAGAMSGMSALTANASTLSGNKVLVGIFLKGGIDAFDLLMPYDEPSFSAFTGLRQGVMAAHEAQNPRSRETLLALNPENASQFGGRQFAMAPEFEDIHSLFSSGDCAVIGNVGPLIEPTDRAGMESGRQAAPDRLFSHNDQQSTWMSMGPEGTLSGWGGRFSDTTRDTATYPEFTALSASNLDVFLSGHRTRPFRMPSEIGKVSINVVKQRWRTSGGHGDEARARMAAYLQANVDPKANIFGRDAARARARGIQHQTRFQEFFEGQPLLSTEFPDTGLGKKLNVIANSIKFQPVFGNPRQIYYATMGGFDTHDDQGTALPPRAREISSAIAAFRQSMIEAGRWDDVVLFTMSDFGRTLTDNGNGTDHGWGSHHFVFGGSVQGNRIYGNLPELEPGSDRFTASRARLIPDVSVDQYAATLGHWFGVGQADLVNILPNLNRFDQQDLGFMGGVAV